MPSSATDRKTSRRPRAVQACNLCRAKKYKCDGNLPCVHCQRQGVDCVYQGAPRQADIGLYSVAYAKKLERRLVAAEAALSSQGLHLNDDLETCRVDSNRQVTDQSNLKEQFATPESFNAGSMETNQTTQQSDEASDDGTIEAETMNDEVMDINMNNQAFEYHGETSSIAFLERLRRITEPAESEVGSCASLFLRASDRSLVTELHNDAFIHHEETPAWIVEPNNNDEFYPLQAYTFLESYFASHHCIYPIFDKEEILARSRKLWDGRSDAVERSHKAVYFAILALGALTRTWNEDSLCGMGRYEWTLLLFRKAEVALGRPGSFPNMTTVQAFFILAKICQAQLDLNLAYTYLGMGIRVALTCGINRLAVFRMKDFPQDSPTLQVARTWWALYSFEIELSFALGRPDTLGMDFYHNRPVPMLNNSETDMIRATLDLSMVIRDVTASVHQKAIKVAERLSQASKLEQELNGWLAQLPEKIRPTSGTDVLNSGSIHDQQWTKLQLFVLNIRYLHVKMVLFHPFFQLATKAGSKSKLSPGLIEAAEKCVESAVKMIRIIHDTYRTHHFMRTWYYNTVYLSFGMSVLLVYELRRPFASHWDYRLLLHIEQSLDVLETMKECKVAKKTANFAREFLHILRKQQSTSEILPGNDQAMMTDLPGPRSGVPAFNELFPDYIGELEDYAQLSLFDEAFIHPNTGAENAIV
ncbi:putative c6 transcription protein [Venturia nashicola]|uniref:Putative c6 transcription protein n=1 Tax=Venturia nashicola TaxID=86259 RepID=A0A4Z1NRS5_9PEZI|nr:putative c6 transcription protein [Venturia nashicola]TLD26256.1 putative c6 transcription protein [Venturia nashicola]